MQMKERGWIEPVVERVVGQVLDSHATQLRTEIVRRVMEEIAAEPGSQGSGPVCNPADLARAVSEIQLGSSQREILRALLDTSARYASRVALFVVKGGRATGWQARGFPYNEAVKDFSLDENAPAVVRAMDDSAIGDHMPASASASDLDPCFLEEFGTPASGQCTIVPLLLKDKVAALVYADSGTGAEGCVDAGALELLVLSASAWLEVNSLRKQSQKETAHTSHHAVPAAEMPWSEAPQYTAPAQNEAFAMPEHDNAMAAAASAGDFSTPVSSIAEDVSAMVADTEVENSELQEVENSPLQYDASVEVEQPLEPPPIELLPAEPLPTELFSTELLPMEPSPVHRAESDAAPGPEPEPDASISPQDLDVHRKAQRFARLLVDEIKLYNQAKVTEGRNHKDLYDRLQEPIEKSRATYQKRYGNTVAGPANYFQHEIIRSLAEDDLSMMGANFRD